MPLGPGAKLGSYEILGQIGAGGMGVVYRARHPERGLVALKTLARDDQDPAARKRLRREASVLARIQHPNVCRVFEFGDCDGQLFIAMELLEGESLAERLRRSAVRLREAVGIARDVLSALAAVHEHNLVHRDMKPSNVMLTPEGVRVVDFGLARRTAASPDDVTHSEVTRTGMIVGTPHYMSPEQIRRLAVDARSDIFSLGAVLFETITGRRAFAGNDLIQATHSILENEPPALGGSPAVAVVDRVIRRALRKKPSARYTNAVEMSAALEEVIRACGDDEAPTCFAVTRLVVVPFRLSPPDPEKEFLASGVPEGITNALSSLDSVIVRDSAVATKFANDSPDYEALAREADVDVALKGSMVSAGDRLRVTCQLVRVPEGTVEWSHEATLQGTDAIELLDTIVERVIESLSLSLTKREHRLLKRELPGNPAAFECVVRASLALGAQMAHGSEKLEIATQLLERAVSEDPDYPDAWARLARCHWVRAKSRDRAANRAHARKCLERALELAPELPLAHHVAAFAEIDTGDARKAMSRLVQRLGWGGAHPELYAALVQASRYCGLLEVSVAAHERLRQLDRALPSSGYQTYWRLGRHDKAMSEAPEAAYYEAYYRGAVQGDRSGALRLLRSWEATAVPFMRPLLAASRALFEDDEVGCVENAESVIGRFPDPEVVFLMVRYISYFGHTERVVGVLEKVLDGGYNWFRTVRAPDPWLRRLFEVPEFLALEERAKEGYLQARTDFYASGGGNLLGVDLPEAAVPTGRP